MKNRIPGVLLLLALASYAFTGTAQTRGPRNPGGTPAVVPERPFQPSLRNEKTLPNGLQVIVVRRPTVPKVSARI